MKFRTNFESTHGAQKAHSFLFNFTVGDAMNGFIHNSQNVCRHGKYFGFVNCSRQIEHVNTLSSSKAAIALTFKRVNSYLQG